MKGKNGTVNRNGELSGPQFRAIENYRRRIYDAWSVLRASGIIEKVDSRHFQFNKDFIVHGRDDCEDEQAVRASHKTTVSAQQLAAVLANIKDEKSNKVRQDYTYNSRTQRKYHG